MPDVDTGYNKPLARMVPPSPQCKYLLLRNTKATLTYQQDERFKLEVSASLRTEPRRTGSRMWLSEMRDANVLLSALLMITHPNLYRIGRRSFLQMAVTTSESEDPIEMQKVLAIWGSVFSALSVVSNRETPLHRDPSSAVQWCDILATVGDYTGATLELPGIGIGFDYRPGTVMAFSGRLLQHGVSKVKGDRLCLAYYMRDGVHERLGLEAPGWMTLRSG